MYCLWLHITVHTSEDFYPHTPSSSPSPPPVASLPFPLPHLPPCPSQLSLPLSLSPTVLVPAPPPYPTLYQVRWQTSLHQPTILAQRGALIVFRFRSAFIHIKAFRWRFRQALATWRTLVFLKQIISYFLSSIHCFAFFSFFSKIISANPIVR